MSIKSHRWTISFFLHKTKKILAIDDDLDFVDAVTAILKSGLDDVATASNPKEGKEKLFSEKTDLIHIFSNTFVQGYEETLEQVFSNLLSNAIKYNRPKGSVRITLKKELTPENLKIIQNQLKELGYLD